MIIIIHLLLCLLVLSLSTSIITEGFSTDYSTRFLGRIFDVIIRATKIFTLSLALIIECVTVVYVFNLLGDLIG